MTIAQLNHSSAVVNLINDGERRHTVIMSYERQRPRTNVIHSTAESLLYRAAVESGNPVITRVCFHRRRSGQWRHVGELTPHGKEGSRSRPWSDPRAQSQTSAGGCRRVIETVLNSPVYEHLYGQSVHTSHVFVEAYLT
ncbi:hypothetical protein D9C73_008900 [Collichthys lucidus]|uniref:Uncharacterized protein n=1 Tax=Collichthys lucidus TaxID=240159 RepID=A0A4U5UJ65_COLLU|nr:hypothetical protein D9C73_008900 [Collichthys lucidus]